MSKSVSVIVPTLNPGDNLPALQEALTHQRLRPLEVIIVDSASTDQSPEKWQTAGFRVFSIQRSSFNHGRTRNFGARRSRGNILVFMTQDAIPTDRNWLENLITPITSAEAVATYARQVPKEDANLLERFARTFNYPAKSRVKGLTDLPELGYKTFFFSNVCSAIRADVFWEVGGFPEDVIMNEDVLLCVKLLKAGYKVKYEAKAQVYHSHDYGALQQLRRNFDIGASISQAGSLLKEAHTSREGLRFVFGQTKYVFRSGDLLGVFRVFTEAGVRLLGFSLGKRERHIPRAVKRRLSMHSYFWG